MNERIKLESILNQYGMTLHLLSKASGVAYATVYGLFTGKKRVADARVDTLKRIGEVLDLRMDELYDLLTPADDRHPAAPLPDFTLMYRDEQVADVRINGDRVLVKRYILCPARQIFYADEIPLYTFGEIIRGRCWDTSRPDLPQLLHLIGLKEYNPYRIVRKTHGMMAQDALWFRFSGEKLSYQDVRRINFATGTYS